MDYLKNLVDNNNGAQSSSGESTSEDGTGTEDSNNNEERWNSDEEFGWDLETYLDLQVPEEFIKALIEQYGSQPGADLSKLSAEDRMIQVGSEICFEIFRSLYGSVNKNAAGMNKKPSWTVGTCSSPHPINNEDEEDLKDILKQIEELERDERQAEEIEKRGLEIKGTFQDIIARDRIAAAQELQKYQESKKIKWTMAQNVKCSQLKAVFPKLEAKIIEDIFLQNGFSYDLALSCLKDIYPSKFEERTPRGKVQPVARYKSSCGNDWSYDPEAVATIDQLEKARLLDQAALWRSDADYYGKLHENAKVDAMDHKPVKKAYSLKLVEVGRIRQEANRALEQYWFFSLMGLNAGNKNPNKIDLHGLSVNKAKEIAQKYLQNRKIWVANHMPRNSFVSVLMITGIGRHSINNIPRLYPAIKQFLNDNHYLYSEGDIGNFHVKITNTPDITKGLKPHHSWIVMKSKAK